MELKSFDVFPKVVTVNDSRSNEIFGVIDSFVNGKNIPIVEKKEKEVCFWFSELKVTCYLDNRGLTKKELMDTLKEEKNEYDHDARLKLARETYRKTREKFLEGR
jgi:hypothetical protein